MKRLLSILVLALPLLATAVTPGPGSPALAAARPANHHGHRHHHGHHCNYRSYSAFCRHIHPGPCRTPISGRHVTRNSAYCRKGPWVGFHVPGRKHDTLEIYVRTNRLHGLEVIVQSVGCPGNTPQHGGWCYRTQAYRWDPRTHKYDISVQPQDFSTETNGAFYSYNPRTNTYTKLHPVGFNHKTGKWIYVIKPDVIYYVKP